LLMEGTKYGWDNPRRRLASYSGWIGRGQACWI